jgi:hypothetical protein
MLHQESVEQPVNASIVDYFEDSFVHDTSESEEEQV